MSQPPSPNRRQQSNVKDSLVKGQVGQAGRDLWQFQFFFSRQISNLQQERQNRQALIDKVRNFWVRGVLEKSLHSQAVIELNLEKCLDAVGQPFRMDWMTPDRLRQSLPTGTKVIDLFSQMGEGGTLLILGEPGSGKTMTLLGLARDLLDRAEQDANQPIPVVFNLSSWRGGNQTIVDWLVQELREKYQVPKTLAKDWIKNQQLLLLFDGLDEVHADYRDACVSALNLFIEEYGKSKAVVCSRVNDYKVLSKRLKFQGAIYIKPLTIEQVNQYLDIADTELAGINSALQIDSILQELVRTPFMLSIVALTYHGVAAKELPKANSEQAYLDQLFNAYIERMFFRRKSKNQRYSNQKCKQWLTRLAQQMHLESQSIFFIEHMQNNWLQHYYEKETYVIYVKLILGLLIGILLSLYLIVNHDSNSSFIGIFLKIFLGLLFSPLLILIVPFVGDKFLTLEGKCRALFQEWIMAEIKPVEKLTLKWSKRSIADLFLNGIGGGIVGAVVGLLFCLVLFLRFNFTPNWSLIIRWVLAVGVFCGMFSQLTKRNSLIHPTSELEVQSVPNQGTWQSVRNGVFLSLVAGAGLAFIAPLIGISTISGVITGVAIGQFFGGIAAAKHLALRIVLCRYGHIPWNYARFLNYAAERIFLQKVGGGYIFIHRLLLEHFAQMEPEQVRR